LRAAGADAAGGRAGGRAGPPSLPESEKSLRPRGRHNLSEEELWDRTDAVFRPPPPRPLY
jgi:hypothetical protein